MKNIGTKCVFIDTNVLINDFMYRERHREESRTAYNALLYLRTRGAGLRTHIASFSLVQVHSTLSRAKVPHTDIATEIRRIIERHVVINFSKEDILSALALQAKDLEDAMQYTLAKKMKCTHIITENKKDFKGFEEMDTLHPKNARIIT